MIEKSEDIEQISAALAAASKEIGGAVKDADNPFFKSKYADLASVIEVAKGPLERNGIVVLQPMTTEGDKTYLHTMLLHSSGEFIASRIPLDISGKEQALGSRITYLRRYQLQAMLSIPTVDDDGEAAMQRQPPKTSGRVTADQLQKLTFKMSVAHIDQTKMYAVLREKFGIKDLRQLNQEQLGWLNNMIDRKSDGRAVEA